MVMTEKVCKTSRSLRFLALLLVCIVGNYQVIAAPQPIPPGMMYREDYGVDVPSQTLADRLQQIVEKKEEKIEREIEELAEERMEIQSLIEAKNQRENQQTQDFTVEDPETLPVPAPIHHLSISSHSGKRTFMALCHFKICNMGRKRQTRAYPVEETRHHLN